MDLLTLPIEERISYLIKPILKVLQDAGGQLKRYEIRERVAEMDDDILIYSQYKKKSKKTGREYKDFDLRFNFAIKDLYFNHYLDTKDNAMIFLTSEGLEADIDKLDVRHIIKKSKECWEQVCKSNNKNKDKKETVDEEILEEDNFEAKFHDDLLDAIANMKPQNFEIFTRALLTRMNIEFDSVKGVQLTKDGGIDGYGYHKDLNNFKTSKVVIQCKRYNTNAISVNEIRSFIGAVNTHTADYGIFVTNSYFTKDAKKEALKASPIITLIDGDELVRLVSKYLLYVKLITTYTLEDFYKEN